MRAIRTGIADLSGLSSGNVTTRHTGLVTEFLQRVGDHVGGWLYLITAALAFGEAAILIGMVLPGETALLVAGYFCHEGVLDIWIMLPVAIAAAIVGDSVGYGFGRRFGKPLRAFRLGRRVGEHRC